LVIESQPASTFAFKKPTPGAIHRLTTDETADILAVSLDIGSLPLVSDIACEAFIKLSK
jgi:hypothetical protein